MDENFNGEALVLKVFINNTDKFRHNPLYEVLVYAARRYGLSGASVLKGVMGFGSSTKVHSMKFWEISEKLPVVIEIIDEPHKIEKFTRKIMPWFDKLHYGCLISVEKANIILYKKGQK